MLQHACYSTLITTKFTHCQSCRTKSYSHSKKNMNTLIVIISCLLVPHAVHSFLFNKQLETVNLGKNQLVVLQGNAQWSTCWKDAVSALEQGCKDLSSNDEKRSKLAVALANCHLSKSGLQTYTCTKDMTVQECTKNMLASTIAFNTYTEFTTHVGTS
jgi:erythromycin esterase-like protein